MTAVSAIVPATNHPGTLERCLAAIRSAREAPEEVIVVDAPSLAGPAEARNDGARRASGDILVFVDADVVVHPDAFSRIREVLAVDPDLTAVFGSYDDDPPAPGWVSAFRNLLHHHVHHEAAGPAATFWAGLGAARREDFLRAGGFDADTYKLPSVEDIELGMRLSARGGRILLDPRIQGTHLKEWSLLDMVRTDFARRGVPWVALLLRSKTASSTALNLGWRHRASAVASLVGVGVLVQRRPLRAAGAALVLVGLNRSFYALLVRRRGWAEAVGGIGVHALHHLAGAAAVPVGVIAHLRDRRR